MLALPAPEDWMRGDRRVITGQFCTTRLSVPLGLNVGRGGTTQASSAGSWKEDVTSLNL